MPKAQATEATSDPRIVSFMNQKGGVGKTTTVVNIAAALAEAGHTVLVADLDPQAHATLHLGIELEEADATIYDVLHNGATIDAAIIEARPKLYLLPSTVDLAAAETELASAPDRHKRLGNALAAMSNRFDYVLIDCPPSLGLLTLNGLSASHEVVIPMQAHFLALQGVGKLLESVQLVAQELNPGLRVAGVMLCMHDDNTRHAKEVVADLEQFFEQSRGADVPWRDACVYRPAVRRNIKVAESPSFGQTIFEYARWCAGATDYRRVAEAFVGDVTKPAKTPTEAEHDLPESPAEPAVVVRPIHESERVA